MTVNDRLQLRENPPNGERSGGNKTMQAFQISNFKRDNERVLRAQSSDFKDHSSEFPGCDRTFARQMIGVNSILI